jgi:hypothetical protein
MKYFDKDKEAFFYRATNIFSRAFTQGVDGLDGLNVCQSLDGR